MSAESELLLRRFAGRGRIFGSTGDDGAAGALIDPIDLEEFVGAARGMIHSAAHGEVLERAVLITLQSEAAPLEVSFVGLYVALESALTFFRRQGDYDILTPEHFSRLEKDLRGWLRRHPLLEHEAAKRGLIYEKVRELNRFPFSHLFKGFREQHALDLSDLWPVLGRPEEWPLMEIRHRLVHGDPFASRPPEAIACARQHLSWTVERMLLSVLGWPVPRSGATGDRLQNAGRLYAEWPSARSSLA